VGTGYGTQAADVLPRFKADGYEVAAVANYGLAGSTVDWGGIPILPQGYDGWSNDLAPLHIKHFIKDDGIGIVLYDVWTLKGPLWDGIPLACWTPVDHDPAPPEVVAFFKQPNQRHYAIAMSEFGRDRLTRAGVADVLYVPHAIDTSLFSPEGINFRAQIGIPEDAHLTVVNNANKGVPPRKSWPELLAAWAIFAKQKPDAWLYLHTEQHGLGSGVNLIRLLHAVDAPMDRVKFVPQYQYRTGIPTSEMPAIYRMGDVLLQPSRGEGFGIPSIEAQSCGLPVIVSKFSAQPELVGAGWQVGGQLDWSEGMASWQLIPAVSEIVEALMAAYEAKDDKNLRAKARAFALGYDSAVVYEKHWRPVLSELADRLSPQLNREQRRAALKGKK
jgi:glycosyltransferase involved in cell wall biosynthesis